MRKARIGEMGSKDSAFIAVLDPPNRCQNRVVDHPPNLDRTSAVIIRSPTAGRKQLHFHSGRWLVSSHQTKR
jgi:hypothetical protein